MRRLCCLTLGTLACAGAPVPLPTPPPAPVAHVEAPAPAPPPPAPPASPEPSYRVTPDAPFRARPPLPAAGPSRPFQLPAVTRFRLSCGLPVVLAESHRLPLVQLELVVKAGNAESPRDLVGLASLLTRMMDQGAGDRTAEGLAEPLAAVGATLQARAGWDATSLALQVPSDQLDAALEVWTDVALRPRLSDDDLARSRDGWLIQAARRRDDGATIADTVLARVLFGQGHPYAQPDEPTEPAIRRVTGSDLRAFHERHFRPNNATLVVAGDITPAELRAKLEPRLRGWRARPVPPTVVPPPPSRTAATIYLVDRPGPAAHVRVGAVGLARRSPDYPRALVMNHLLGGSFRRLDLSVRAQRGWATRVRSVFEARRGVGPWVTRAEVAGPQAADAVAEILRTLRGLRESDVSEHELRDSKDEIVLAYPGRWATSSLVAAQMAAQAVYDLPAAALAGFPQRIAAITAADVRRTAQQYLKAERLAVVVVGDAKALEDKLRKLGPVELRDVDGHLRVPAVAVRGARLPSGVD